ncbi:MAG: TetR/AcrR family transcriptional regulator [Lachnospiraceae bacterium]|nr:TetR/AcrR family transcriptional regulator [Lachnospiraceae bacterium]
MRKTVNQTKSRIVSAAWKLFYEYGYSNTTIDDIIELAQTSKGSFYHYFESKDDLLGSLSYLFDEKYEELTEAMDPSLSPAEKLVYINQELFLMIENTVPVTLLTQLFRSQLTTKGEKHLLDPDRIYYRLLRKIAAEGKEKNCFREDLSVNDITKAYAIYERAMMYDWCICGGNYSLCQYAAKMLPLFLDGLK